MFKSMTVSKNLSHTKKIGYRKKMPYHDRLKEAQAIDLRNNLKIIDYGNGYSSNMPIDEKKLFN